jgi:hypothetical protein
VRENSTQKPLKPVEFTFFELFRAGMQFGIGSAKESSEIGVDTLKRV